LIDKALARLMSEAQLAVFGDRFAARAEKWNAFSLDFADDETFVGWRPCGVFEKHGCRRQVAEIPL
jgi:hypothetical protein